MASNVSVGHKKVKIAPMPASITDTQLAEKIDLPNSRIRISKVKENHTRYARINDFISEEEANRFARKWSGSSIFGETIKCDVVAPKTDETDAHHSSHRSLMPPVQRVVRRREDISTPPTAREPFMVPVMSRIPSAGIHDDENKLPKPSSQRSSRTLQKQQECSTTRSVVPQEAISVSSTTSSSIEKKDDDNEHLLISSTNKETSSPSIFITEHRRSGSCLPTSSRHTINLRGTPCLNAVKCFNPMCEFDHPDGWNPCKDGVNCENYDCKANHPFKRKKICRDGGSCKRTDCIFLHPKKRTEECLLRAQCKKWDCEKMHPGSRPWRCSDEENCANLICECLHPPERDKLLCPIGADCRNILCSYSHPPERLSICNQRNKCSNVYCTDLHGSDWNPCEAGDKCEDKDCHKMHPRQSVNNIAEVPPISIVTDNQNVKKKKNLKSLEQRRKDREKVPLPILSCKHEFCQRLEHERMLVVTAETGSGKSTQLPQYAAEHFGSLVVCTQPRVVAALSLARRVAQEYDGRSAGESVGYKVGNANEVTGASIMFMTDTALIRDSQRDPSLKRIRVLIIDEAHERSLNTDIVIGMAKMLLAQRPNDFYVVITSATIDPAHFLHFFDRSTNAPLNVKGRVFPVTLLNQPLVANFTDPNLIETHIVSSVLQLYPHHKGHTLVFLPGQGEIERALSTFNSTLPSDCIALPLYGSQSPEDQEKVIKFNQNEKRMVVFCTNVAETSLTIADVQLVIDSGWAKEARYDVKRRLTVIETVRISRSSADQRKGRAGRTGPGHCVRLYEDVELKRSNIEPEILRSSLDFVLLQLIRLNLDPNTFPFMDQPKTDVINNSIELLTRLQCIDDQKVTKKGEFYSELRLDPRLSAFIVETYTEYGGLLELTTGIVAILAAPGIVFFIGGATRKAKQEAKNRIAEQAQNYKSDLFHLYSVYAGWRNARTKDTTGECSVCKKQVIWCICRIKYSTENGLNNKILQIIDSSYMSIIRQIKNARWLKSGTQMSLNAIDIIGEKLAQLFPEQCGYLLQPKSPAEGVHLVSTNIRASINGTSVFMQKLHTDSNNEFYQHFVAMSITQSSQGKHFVDKLHPILKTSAVVQSSIDNVMIIENVIMKINTGNQYLQYFSFSSPAIDEQIVLQWK